MGKFKNSFLNYRLERSIAVYTESVCVQKRTATHKLNYTETELQGEPNCNIHINDL